MIRSHGDVTALLHESPGTLWWGDIATWFLQKHFYLFTLTTTSSCHVEPLKHLKHGWQNNREAHFNSYLANTVMETDNI